MSGKKDLFIRQGETFTLGFTYFKRGPLDTDGNVTLGPRHDLTGCIVRMQIRKKQKTPVLFSGSTENGKIVVGAALGQPAFPLDPTNGRIEVRMTDEDTDLLTSRTALYDLEVEWPNGHVKRILQGSVTVDPNITQEEDDPEVGA